MRRAPWWPMVKPPLPIRSSLELDTCPHGYVAEAWCPRCWAALVAAAEVES